jgi:ribosomal protein L32
MSFELLRIRLGNCRYAFIAFAVVMMAFAWIQAHPESGSSPAESSKAASQSVQQNSEKPLASNCQQCGEKVGPGGVCKNCGRVIKGSTGGADPSAGVRNRMKSDLSNINRTNSNISRSLRNMNNSIRNMNQNIFRIRDIRRRL